MKTLLLALICGALLTKNMIQTRHVPNIKIRYYQREDTIIVGNRTVSYTNINLATFKSLTVKAFKQSVSKSPITKRKGVIKILLSNGKYANFRDVTHHETDNKTYTLEGILANRFYILTAKYYDNGETVLLDKVNGNISTLWGDPVLSPDGKCLLSYSAYLDYDIMPTGMQFYVMENNKLKLERAFKTTEWEPTSIKWIDNNTFIVSKLIPSYMSPNKQDIKSYLKFTFK